MSWELTVSVIGIFLTVLTGAVILSYRLGCHRRDLKALSDQMQAGFTGLRDQMSGQLTLIGVLISILHKRKALDDAEFQEVIKTYGEMATKNAPTFVPTGNPLSYDDARRLNNYVDKARRGQFFTSWEVEDYNALIRQVQQDRPNDPGLWPLAALGAFLLGLFLASKK
jgi:hypothetical protein